LVSILPILNIGTQYYYISFSSTKHSQGTTVACAQRALNKPKEKYHTLHTAQAQFTKFCA